MANLFDIARAAQSGMGLQNLSREFGLDPDQARRAVEALLPAFTMAFRQTAVDPVAFANLAGAVGSGLYAPYFDGTAAGSGAARPETVVAQLFGSDAVARQIAAQASGLTGIGAQVIHRMLPVLAAMLVGGMFRYASVDGVADFLRHWSDALRSMQPKTASPPPAPDPWAAWTSVVSASLGAPPTPEPAPAPPPENPFEAWSRLMTSMVGGAAPPPPPPPPAANPAQALTRMFETGLDVQAQYLTSLQSVFGQAWTTPARS